MKRYLALLLILAIACGFSISAVVATDFEKMDFDGKFKMDVVNGCDFVRTEDDGLVTFMDIDKGISVFYIEDSSISKDMDEIYYDAFKSSSGFEDDGTEGNIRVYKNPDMYGALLTDEGIAVAVGSTDRSEAIEMAQSIEFTNK